MAQRYDGISGQVLSASAYLGSSASGNMRIGLYADNAGEPGALLGASEIKAVASTSSGHWEVFTFAPTEQVEPIEGTHVWLAVHSSASINSRGSDGANQNAGRRLISQAFASGLPDPYGAGSSYNNTRHEDEGLDEPDMTNNLDLAQVAPSQNNKEVTINDQAGQLDAALTEVLTIEVDDSNAYALSASQLRRHFFIVVTEGSPVPTAEIMVQVPAIRRGLFKLLNVAQQTVAIEVPGQSEPAPQIPVGENRMLSCDGFDVRPAGIGTPDLGSASIGELLDVEISGITAGQQLRWNGTTLVPVTEPFDVGLHLPDLSTAGALLAEIVLARPVDLPAAFAGSTGYARVAATGETVLDVQKNGSNIGTVTFAAAISTPVFALTSATSFAAGDRLGIVNEDPADATLAGVSLTFAGTRGS